MLRYALFQDLGCPTGVVRRGLDVAPVGLGNVDRLIEVQHV